MLSKMRRADEKGGVLNGETISKTIFISLFGVAITMNTFADNLLYWASHHGRVREKELLKAAHALLHNHDEETRPRYARMARARLLFLAHALREGEWLQVISPCLALLPERDEPTQEAVLVGARSPDALSQLERAAQGEECTISQEELKCAPRRIALRGGLDALRAVAARLEIKLVRDAPMQALRLFCSATTANGVAPPPTGVTPHIYRMEAGEWVEQEAPAEYDACRFKPQYSGFSYFVKVATGYVEASSEGAAVFLAAHLQRRRICRYDATQRIFASPKAFPHEIARALCLCSGHLASFSGAERLYFDVPPSIARAALERLGQDFRQDDGAQIAKAGGAFIHWLS
jgi:hypothetical protein